MYWPHFSHHVQQKTQTGRETIHTTVSRLGTYSHSVHASQQGTNSISPFKWRVYISILTYNLHTCTQRMSQCPPFVRSWEGLISISSSIIVSMVLALLQIPFVVLHIIMREVGQRLLPPKLSFFQSIIPGNWYTSWLNEDHCILLAHLLLRLLFSSSY